MKRIFTFLLICTMFLSLVASSYAVDNNQQENELIIENTEELIEVIELSLKDAINYALEHNKDLTIQDLNIKKAEVSYENNIRIVKNYNRNKDLIDSLPTPADELVQQKLLELGATERSLDLSLNIAKWNKQIKENEIKYNVEKAYYDLLLAEEQMEIAKESLELAQDQYEKGKTMYEVGTISSQQLLEMELAVSQAQSGYDAAEMGYEMQKMSFNNTLGLPLDQKVVLTDEIEYKEHEEINLEKSIKEALENNGSLKVAKENYELAQLTLEATKARYPEITYKYREQEILVEQAAKSLDMAKNGVEMGVRSAYLQLITAEKQIKTYEKTVEKAQRALELAEISFELGQSTSTEVSQARLQLMDAKNNLAKQIHAYNMALLDFHYSTGLGKTQISTGY
ncbi:TolC family protein [Caldisalinibacter kiritimatiensis]|uniref:Outer membrane efflux protein n=1 Tax=Caldisalinibacter kiritimatiensis TaxID=1304284 RepID=R1CYW4_9FIRM|nr:TolC family protein [Caldisalinibacter kiritimatiensis]EOD01774.1 outer membrane efflux protein [Caldisalinibacter kiritimatiensis]